MVCWSREAAVRAGAAVRGWIAGAAVRGWMAGAAVEYRDAPAVLAGRFMGGVPLVKNEGEALDQ